MFQEELTFGNIRNNLHGLAPSATSRSLRDFKSISLWSFFASIPQCISRDLAILTAATNVIKLNHHWEQFAYYHYYKWALLEFKPTWITFGLAWSNIPLNVAATLLKGHTVIFSDEFEPGGRIRLHERVWNENHMHAIEYALQNIKYKNISSWVIQWSRQIVEQSNCTYIHIAEFIWIQ